MEDFNETATKQYVLQHYFEGLKFYEKAKRRADIAIVLSLISILALTVTIVLSL